MGSVHVRAIRETTGKGEGTEEEGAACAKALGPVGLKNHRSGQGWVFWTLSYPKSK